MAMILYDEPINQSTREGQQLCFDWQKCEPTLKEKLVFILTRYFPVLTVHALATSYDKSVLTDEAFFSGAIPSLETSKYLIIQVQSQKLYVSLLYFMERLELDDLQISMMI